MSMFSKATTRPMAPAPAPLQMNGYRGTPRARENYPDDDSLIEIQFPFEVKNIFDAAKAQLGKACKARWNPEKKVWRVSKNLQDLFHKMYDAECDAGVSVRVPPPAAKKPTKEQAIAGVFAALEVLQGVVEEEMGKVNAGDFIPMGVETDDVLMDLKMQLSAYRRLGRQLEEYNKISTHQI